jgi:dolichol-phosphate mannosyltransferase
MRFSGKLNHDMNATDLSVIVPAFNEAVVLPSLVDRLRGVLAGFEVSYEILIVNDGSTDGTEAYLEALSRKDPRIKPVNLARNFGKEAAMAAGLASAMGKCIVFIDADLQHPPDVIRRMYLAWQEGSDVVNAVKRQRSSEFFLYRWFANRFNGIMSAVIGSQMAGASDFKLIDRQVADVLLDCPERNRFFRGLVAWVGFRVADVEFDVVERELGSSKWTLASLIRYSLSNIVAFSSLPLVAVAYVGFVTAALGLLLLVQALVRWIMGTAAIGFTTVIAVQVLLGGMILTALGVIAIYLSRMYDEQKSRPLFIIKRPRESRAKAEDPARAVKQI